MAASLRHMKPAGRHTLDVVQLTHDITTRLKGHEITLQYHQVCDSTNSECMRLERHGGVVIAEQQTSGRGRRGNAWHSPAANNIYCSIGIVKTLPARLLGLVSLQAGVSTARVLHRFGFSGVRLKWPNDILLNERKLGGILTESRTCGSGTFFLVIGLGLNSTSDLSVLQAIERPSASLGELAPHGVDRQTLISELVGDIFSATLALDEGSSAGLIEEFLLHDHLYGRQVVVHTPERSLPGFYQGLEETGNIRIATADGIQTFAAAEISLREHPDAAHRLR